MTTLSARPRCELLRWFGRRRGADGLSHSQMKFNPPLFHPNSAFTPVALFGRADSRRTSSLRVRRRLHFDLARAWGRPELVRVCEREVRISMASYRRGADKVLVRQVEPGAERGEDPVERDLDACR